MPSAHKERMRKLVFKPWTVGRIFAAGGSELVEREWQLSHLLHLVQAELELVQKCIKEKKG